MFFDNIILILNVLEQFAIRVTIFNVDIEDIINYVNKLYFGDNDDFIKNLLKKPYVNETNMIDPKVLVRQSLMDMDKKLINNIIFEKITYHPDAHIRFIY